MITNNAFKAEQQYSTALYVAHVLYCIRNTGWISSKLTNRPSWMVITSEDAKRHYNDAIPPKYIIDSGVIISWMLNDYKPPGAARNYFVDAVSKPAVIESALDVVAATVPVYLRLHTVNVDSAHVGTVGVRHVARITLVEEMIVRTAYSKTYSAQYMFNDRSGNAYMWFTKYGKLVVGNEYYGAITIKSHRVSDGRKINVITRANIS